MPLLEGLKEGAKKLLKPIRVSPYGFLLTAAGAAVLTANAMNYISSLKQSCMRPLSLPWTLVGAAWTVLGVVNYKIGWDNYYYMYKLMEDLGFDTGHLKNWAPPHDQFYHRQSMWVAADELRYGEDFKRFDSGLPNNFRRYFPLI